MHSRLLLFALAAAACRPAPARVERRDSTPTARPLEAAPVVREPTVVAFWLPATDTLKQGEGADLLDDFRSYTGAVSPLLEKQGIRLETTNGGIEARNLDGGWLTWRNSPAASSERGQAAAVAPAPGHRRSSSDLAVKAS